MPILAAIMVLAVALLAFPAGVGGKFTCADRGNRPHGFVLRGLPAAPVAERVYPLAVTLQRRRHGVNPTPYLGAERCGAGGVGGAGGWFRRAKGNRYELSLRFPRPGRWALSFMDRGGTFYDVGLRRVRARSTVSGRSALCPARAARAARCGPAGRDRPRPRPSRRRCA